MPFGLSVELTAFDRLEERPRRNWRVGSYRIQGWHLRHLLAVTGPDEATSTQLRRYTTGQMLEECEEATLRHERPKMEEAGLKPPRGQPTILRGCKVAARGMRHLAG